MVLYIAWNRILGAKMITKCLCCGKPLSREQSMINGYGEVCRIKLKIKANEKSERQGDMFQSNKADYAIVTFQENILVIEDLDKGSRSLSNAMREVVEELSQTYDFNKVSLIYKDSTGIFDAVVIKDGNFRTFAPISKHTADEAIETFKVKYAKSPLFSVNRYGVKK